MLQNHCSGSAQSGLQSLPRASISRRRTAHKGARPMDVYFSHQCAARIKCGLPGVLVRLHERYEINNLCRDSFTLLFQMKILNENLKVLSYSLF